MSKSDAGRIGVWGASGAGKSAYVKQCIKNLKRVVVFDPLDEYGALPGMKRCRSVEAVRLLMVKNWSGFRIAYVPPASCEPRVLSQLSLLLMKAQEGYKAKGAGRRLTLVVEEMNLSFPLHGDTKARGFAEITSRGRHYGIEVYGLSQRIAEVSTRFRGNCTETIALRQQGPRDVQAAADALGVDRADVQGLLNLEYIHSKNGKITRGKIKFK